MVSIGKVDTCVLWYTIISARSPGTVRHLCLQCERLGIMKACHIQCTHLATVSPLVALTMYEGVHPSVYLDLQVTTQQYRVRQGP